MHSLQSLIVVGSLAFLEILISSYLNLFLCLKLCVLPKLDCVFPSPSMECAGIYLCFTSFLFALSTSFYNIHKIIATSKLEENP
jgi:hypothetical protein